ncbi:LCP family protein [Kitasatospora camelliae]|uniref:LCP family protein n=1 Tax=Kitasatospora camelliae TaxID=3156397 RepID=A0AAU8JVJ0_9ACTN
MPAKPPSAERRAVPSRNRSAARRRRLERWGRLAAGGLSLAVLATSCGGWALLHGVGDAIDRVDAIDVGNRRPADDGVTTFLLAGTDDREGIPEATLKNVLHAGGESCHCTDTLMIVRLADKGGRASVVSIPRDSYVDIPAHEDAATRRPVPAAKGKINAAYGMGGAALTVRTVEQNTGLRIDHYLQINFLGFVAAVDALGGVDVCTSKPLKDERAGLDLPAGTSRLDGAGALKYVRARHLDGSSDLGRMHRQQRFLAQLLRQATESSTLLDPVRLGRVTDSVFKSVKADKGLGTAELLSLTTRLRTLNAGSADFATVPLADIDYQVPGWGSTVRWDEKGAKALFDAVREGRPLAARTDGPVVVAPGGSASGSGSGSGSGEAGGEAAGQAGSGAVAPGTIRVQVLNGSGVQGLGARVDADLRKAGFATTGTPGNAEGGVAGRTVVRYDPRWDESAKILAAAVPGADLVAAPGLGATLQVLIGTDYASPAPSPSAGTPITAEAGSSLTCG